MNNTIFDELNNGITVTPKHEQIKQLREESYATIRLTQQLNASSDPSEITAILSQITGTSIDGSVALFPPLHINYGKNLKLGKNVFINFNCTFLALGGIVIEDNVLIAPNVKILSESHPISPNERHSLIPGKIHIKQNAWIGAGAIILPGVIIGENSIIAAGAVASKNVAPNTIVGGIPAKFIKNI